MTRYPTKRSQSESGYTFVELAIGLVILIIGAVVLANHLSVNYTATNTQKDRVFAFAKAQAILSEIQSFVDRGEITAAIDLDSLDDGVTPKAPLTITTEGAASSLVKADHPLSGNVKREGDWVWWRQISVKPFLGLNNRNVRYVTVKVLKRNADGDNTPVATLSSVVNSVGSGYPTTQVFDVYLLALENIPGWWVFMEAIVPFVESAITDLESRNPGLKLRTHWITKAGYGRNQLYRPYVNEVNDSYTPIEYAYLYPGRMPAGNSSTFYYVPELMKARLSFDGVERGGYDLDTNPFPYALADFYNHAMRLPQARALHDRRIAAIEDREAAIEAAKAAGNTPPAPLYDMSKEPTLQLFLEDLNTDPEKYQSAMVINLHGELVPMPSLRNYSDAARRQSFPETAHQRVVTHPEELRTRRDEGGVTDDVVFRVYAYCDRPDNAPADGKTGLPIALQVMNIDLTEPASPTGLMHGVSIERLAGGVMVGGSMEEYRPFEAAPLDDDPTGGMYYKAFFVDEPGGEKFTVITLHNTPVVAPQINGAGLANSRRARLYGMEYVPCVTGSDATSFAHDLSADGDVPKNSARWRLTLPESLLGTDRFYGPAGPIPGFNANTVVTVRTRFYDDTLSNPGTTGTAFPNPIQPDNVSETYSWWADSREAVPMTERSQFQGDPRHCPYKDLGHGDADFSDGYNWYFDTLNNNSENAHQDFPGIDGNFLRSRWGGTIRQDLQRFFALLRNGLMESNCVYTTLTGFSYYYVGFGNEIGYDSANGYPSSIPINFAPWANKWYNGHTNNLTGERKYVRAADGALRWYARPWLGDLFPDEAAGQWLALDAQLKPIGNIPAGDWGTGKFFRWSQWACHEYGYDDERAWGIELWSARQRSGGWGCVSFMNIQNPTGRFTHHFSTGDNTLVDAGLDLANNYNFPMPAQAPVNRPWSITSWPGAEWGFWRAPYSTERCTGVVVRQYYQHPWGGYIGSGLLQVRNSNNTAGAYIIVNGISNAVVSGSSFIAKYSILTMIQSFFEGGTNTAMPHRISMPPRVEIQSPTEVTEIVGGTGGTLVIPIQYDIEWRRWDGLPYTSNTASNFGEVESDIEYVITYSRDAGKTWLHLDNTPAQIDVKSPAAYRIGDLTPGSETTNWTMTKSQFPEGSYIININAYRMGQELHYSSHRMKIYVSW